MQESENARVEQKGMSDGSGIHNSPGQETDSDSGADPEEDDKSGIGPYFHDEHSEDIQSDRVVFKMEPDSDDCDSNTNLNTSLQGSGGHSEEDDKSGIGPYFHDKDSEDIQSDSVIVKMETDSDDCDSNIYHNPNLQGSGVELQATSQVHEENVKMEPDSDDYDSNTYHNTSLQGSGVELQATSQVHEENVTSIIKREDESDISLNNAAPSGPPEDGNHLSSEAPILGEVLSSAINTSIDTLPFNTKQFGYHFRDGSSSSSNVPVRTGLPGSSSSHNIPVRTELPGSSSSHNVPVRTGLPGSSSSHNVPVRTGLPGSSSSHNVPVRTGLTGSSSNHNVPVRTGLPGLSHGNIDSSYQNIASKVRLPVWSSEKSGRSSALPSGNSSSSMHSAPVRTNVSGLPCVNTMISGPIPGNPNLSEVPFVNRESAVRYVQSTIKLALPPGNIGNTIHNFPVNIKVIGVPGGSTGSSVHNVPVNIQVTSKNTGCSSRNDPASTRPFESSSDTIQNSCKRDMAVQTEDIPPCRSCSQTKKRPKVNMKHAITQTWRTREERSEARTDVNSLKTNITELEAALVAVHSRLATCKHRLSICKRKLQTEEGLNMDLKKFIIRLIPQVGYNSCSGDMANDFLSKLKRIQQITRLMYVFGVIPRMPKEICSIPHDFFHVVFTAMEELEKAGRPNIIYKLATAICLQKVDGTRLLDLNRMPYALVEGNVLAFLGDRKSWQDGYRKWIETQNAWFGEHWYNLFSGMGSKLQPGEEYVTLTPMSARLRTIEDMDITRKKHLLLLATDWNSICATVAAVDANSKSTQNSSVCLKRGCECQTPQNHPSSVVRTTAANSTQRQGVKRQKTHHPSFSLVKAAGSPSDMRSEVTDQQASHEVTSTLQLDTGTVDGASTSAMCEISHASGETHDGQDLSVPVPDVRLGTSVLQGQEKQRLEAVESQSMETNANQSISKEIEVGGSEPDVSALEGLQLSKPQADAVSHSTGGTQAVERSTTAMRATGKDSETIQKDFHVSSAKANPLDILSQPDDTDPGTSTSRKGQSPTSSACAAVHATGASQEFSSSKPTSTGIIPAQGSSKPVMYLVKRRKINKEGQDVSKLPDMFLVKEHPKDATQQGLNRAKSAVCVSAEGTSVSQAIPYPSVSATQSVSTPTVNKVMQATNATQGPSTSQSPISPVIQDTDIPQSADTSQPVTSASPMIQDRDVPQSTDTSQSVTSSRPVLPGTGESQSVDTSQQVTSASPLIQNTGIPQSVIQPVTSADPVIQDTDTLQLVTSTGPNIQDTGESQSVGTSQPGISGSEVFPTRVQALGDDKHPPVFSHQLGVPQSSTPCTVVQSRMATAVPNGQSSLSSSIPSSLPGSRLGAVGVQLASSEQSTSSAIPNQRVRASSVKHKQNVTVVPRTTYAYEKSLLSFEKEFLKDKNSFSFPPVEATCAAFCHEKAQTFQKQKANTSITSQSQASTATPSHHTCMDKTLDGPLPELTIPYIIFENTKRFLEIINRLVPAESDDFWKDPPDFDKNDSFVSIWGPDIEKVRNNAEAPSVRKKKYSVISHLPNATVQEELLSELHSRNPDAKWWIKVGSIDIAHNHSLRYSGKEEFIGDEDLGDGTIQQAEEIYRQRKKLVQALGIGKRSTAWALKRDLSLLIDTLEEDSTYLAEELRKTRAKRGVYRYESLGVARRLAHDDWVDQEVNNWNRMLERNQDLRERLERALEQGTKARVKLLRNNLLDYTTTLTTKKRVLANFVVVFMISDEMQHVKPYSWPVRIVPLETITGEIVVQLRRQLIEKMVELEMNVVGCVKDEWTNHLDVCSPERPVFITQLIAEARQEAATFHLSEMTKYFTAVEWYSPKCELQLVPQWRHEAIPEEDVFWLYKHMKDNEASLEDSLHLLHRKLLPMVESPAPWESKDEQTVEDQYRALMAIYLYRHKIATYAKEGVDFEHSLYVPAIDPVTKQPMHVKEATQKLLKNAAREAKEDESLPQDVKPRLSNLLESWFKASINKKWSGEQRHEANLAMLKYVLEGWMPWLDVADRNYTHVDVNRPIEEVTYMSEEILTSLVINIESDNQHQALHPWASTCQDINTFIALLRFPGRKPLDIRHCTCPTLIQTLCVEFYKAMDPDLEFYYFWTDHPHNIHRMILNLDDIRVRNVWIKRRSKFAKKRALEETNEET